MCGMENNVLWSRFDQVLHALYALLEQKFELRERTGVAGFWDRMMTYIVKPFQPDVPDFDINKDAQTRVRFKTLKHPFIRDKLHL